MLTEAGVQLDASLRASLISQYGAGLSMLRQIVEKCPDELWLSTSLRNQFWRVAYHTLFFVHLYLQPAESDFVPWPKHRDEVESGSGERADATPYSQSDILEYLEFCAVEVRGRVVDMDLHAQSGFPWHRCSRLELQLINIRHLQGHVGELSEQLSDKTGIQIKWVGLTRDSL